MHVMKKAMMMLLSTLMIIQGNVYASSSDIKNTIYNTDIATYLDGKMMICAEDLRNYGYTVGYDDSIRALFVNKTGRPAEDFYPCYERGSIGGISGNTYETDIRVFINGIETSAENMGGKMLVVAEDISDTEVQESNKTSSYNPYAEYGIKACV